MTRRRFATQEHVDALPIGRMRHFALQDVDAMGPGGAFFQGEERRGAVQLLGALGQLRVLDQV
jgi:hypothetical protein